MGGGARMGGVKSSCGERREWALLEHTWVLLFLGWLQYTHYTCSGRALQ